MKKLLTYVLLLVAVAAAVAAPSSALAAQVAAGDSLSLVPEPGDVYVAGGQVSVEGPVDADLTVAGGTVIVDGDVEGDVLAAGGNVVLNGDVKDDVRVAGGNITIFGSIAGDLLVFGGSATLGSDASVGGDVLAFGGMLLIDGDVSGKLIGNAGAAVLHGTVGAVELYAEQLTLAGKINGDAQLVATDSMSVADGATFGGDIRYWTPRGHVDFGEGFSGTASYDETLAVREVVDGSGFLKFILLTLGLSILWNGVLVLLITLLEPRIFRRAAEHLSKNVWKDLGLGAAYFILTPIVAIILMATVVGLPVGGLVMAGYVVSLFLTKTLPAVVLAHWLANRSSNKTAWKISKVFWVGLGLMVALQLIGLIPIVGWLINAAALLTTTGALLVAKYEAFRKVA